MGLTEIASFLLARGYEGPCRDSLAPVAYWYKRLGGHQVVVRQWSASAHFDHSYEVETTFKTLEGDSTVVKIYGVREKDLIVRLGLMEARLLTSVMTLGGDPERYDPETKGVTP